MKVTYYFIGFVVCVQCALLIMAGMGVEPIVMTPVDVDEWEEGFNATGIVTSYDPTQHEFYDVGAGLRYLWNLNIPVIEAPISMLQMFGAPSPIVDAFRVMWRFITVAFVISFFSGRELVP